MLRSWDNEAGWVTGGGDGVAAGVVCRGTSSGIPDKSVNYSSMTISKLLNTCDVCPKEVCQIQCG